MAADHYVTENLLAEVVRWDMIGILKNKKQFKLEHLESVFIIFM